MVLTAKKTRNHLILILFKDPCGWRPYTSSSSTSVGITSTARLPDPHDTYKLASNEVGQNPNTFQHYP
jgi:hypothetical protein